MRSSSLSSVSDEADTVALRFSPGLVTVACTVGQRKVCQLKMHAGHSPPCTDGGGRGHGRQSTLENRLFPEVVAAGEVAHEGTMDHDLREESGGARLHRSLGAWNGRGNRTEACPDTTT